MTNYATKFEVDTQDVLNVVAGVAAPRPHLKSPPNAWNAYAIHHRNRAKQASALLMMLPSLCGDRFGFHTPSLVIDRAPVSAEGLGENMQYKSGLLGSLQDVITGFENTLKRWKHENKLLMFLRIH